MLEGSCLCGAVRWHYDDFPESATACNCSACRRYGALWAYGYEGETFASLARPRHSSAAIRSAFTVAPNAAASPTGADSESIRTAGVALPSTCA